MTEFAVVLKAFVDLVWAGIAVAALWAFRAEIRLLLTRVKKGKISRTGIEFELDALRQAAESARQIPALPEPVIEAREVRALPPAPEPQAEPALHASSPRYAVVLIAAEIEREVRHYVAVTGRLQGRSFLPLPLELERAELPRDLVTAIRRFWEVRNKVVHGLQATDDDAARAADVGLSILATLKALPRERNVVYDPGVELFADPGGTVAINDAKGVVLETTSSDGQTKALRVFPTTRMDYVKGVEVAWEWSARKIWKATWFRHPDDGTIKYAWTEYMEFVGRPLPAL